MRKDVSGQIFGQLTVIRRDDTSKRSRWLCRCDCGNDVSVLLSHLTCGNITRCNKCGKKAASAKITYDLSGKRFGKLTAILLTKNDKNLNQWECRCDCGNTTYVRVGQLTKNLTNSCGSCGTRFRPRIDFTGVVIGEITVTEYLGRSNWNCLCSCGESFTRTTHSLKTSKSKCIKCANKVASEKRRKYACDGLSSQYWKSIVRGAKERNLTINISPEDAYSQLIKQKFKCALSGKEICSPMDYDSKENDGSLDRIDSSKGYTIDNIQWVLKCYNRMKNNFPDDMFIEHCVYVGEHQSYIRSNDEMGYTVGFMGGDIDYDQLPDL